MKLRALFPAVAFLSLLMLFGVAAAPFLSVYSISSVFAQGAAPVFPEADANEDYTRTVDENTKPYDANKDYVKIGEPITATGSGIIYSIENARTSHFGINSYTGHLLVGSPLDHEIKNEYTVFVIAKNTSGTARQEVTINVNDVEEPGKVTLKWHHSGSNVEFEATLDDGDEISGTTTWQWSGSESQNSGYTDIGTATSATFTNDTSYKYLKATATYTDTHSSNKTQDATVKVEPLSDPAGYTLEFDVNTSGGYTCPHRNTNASYDNDGADICVSVPRNATPGDDIYYPASPKYTHATKNTRYPSPGTLRYSLGGTDAGKFDIDPVSRELLPKGSHEYNSPGPDGVFLVEITATDASGRKGSVSIALQPSGSNNKPVVQGPKVIHYPENGTWQVAKYTGTFDNPQQTVGWIISVQPGGGDGDFFDINDDGVLSFTQPPDFEQGQREFSFSLHVYATNGPRGTTYYGVRVIVEDVNDPPEIVGPTDVDFPENNADAVAEYTVEGVDAGEAASWKLEEGDDASKFSITSTGDDSVELRFKSPPDYESFNTGNDEHIFLLTMMVDVGGDMKTEHVRVEVTNVNEAPSFPSETTTRNVDENAGANEAIGAPVEATDPDQNDYLNYDLTGTDDDASFDIGPYSGQLETISGVDYGSKNSYTVTVTATDQGGLDDTITVTITTNPENDAPVFAEGTTATREVPENSPANTNVGAPITADDEDSPSLAYTLEGTGTDKDSFTIDNNGQIKTKTGVTYNYEVKDNYSFTVKASDGTAADTIDVTIDVTNVNETPTFDDGPSTTRSVAENTAAGQNIGLPVAATDPDNENNPNTQTLTYTLGGTDAGSFDIDTSSGQLRTKDALDHDTKATYTVTVSVRDSKDDSGIADSADDDTITVTITVTGENESPTFDDGPSTTRSVAENTIAGTDIGDPAAATDPDDGDTPTYTLEGTDAGSFEIASTDGQIKTKAGVVYDYEAKSSYSVTVKADDSNGGTDTIDVTINLTNVEEPGTVTFAPIPPKAGTFLVATVDDPDGNPSVDTWVWSISATATGTFAPISGETTSGYTPTADDVGKYLKAKATYEDDEGPGKTAEETTTAVTAANTDPTFPGGNNPTPITLSVPENSEANTVVGTVSTTDTDTDPLTYSLDGTQAQVDAFTAAFLLDTSTGEITVLADDSLNFEDKAAYTLAIGVSDGKNAAGDTDTVVDSTVAVTINVTDVNEPPAFDPNEPRTRTVAENTAAGENIGDPFTATDPDVGDTLTYTLDATSDAVFAIVDSSGQLKTKGDLDFEATPSYDVTVTATDGSGATDTIDVTINLTNIDEDGTVTFDPTPPKAGTSLDAAVDDPDEGVSGEMWEWSISDSPNTGFAPISDETSFYYNPVATDVGKYLKVEVSYTDGEGSGKSAEGTTAAVTAVNTEPTFTDDDNDGTPNPLTFDVAENSATGTSVGTVLTTDSDTTDTLIYSLDGEPAEVTAFNEDFDLDTSTGEITVLADDSLNFEDKAAYTLAIGVSDGKNAAGDTDTVVDSTVAVTINVTDVNEPPAFDPNEPRTRTVAENTAAGENIGDPFTATDPDVGDTLTYTLDSASVAVFDIDASGQIKTKAPLDYDTKDSYTVIVSVRDSKDDNGDPDMASDDSIEVTITLTNLNEPPAFPLSETGTRNVDENTAADTAIGNPVAATDPENDTLTYTLGGTDAGSFNFVTTSGQLKTKIGVTYDHETTPSYSVTVSVRDSKDVDGNTDTADDATIAVTINVTGVNEPPVFDAGPVTRAVAENTEAGENVGALVVATDPEDSTLIYTLEGTDAASFTIVESSGQLKTKTGVTYDHETNTDYSVTVKADDGNGGTDTTDVTITVTDVDEPPGKPDPPELEPEAIEGHSKLTVTWDPPANTGPELTSYTFAYRKHDVEEWTTQTIDITPAIETNPTLNVTGLLPETTYFARVQATNDEGTGDWSDEGSGTTAIKPQADWFDLTVDYGAATYTVTEGSSVDITVELSAEADRKLAVPITVTAGTAESGDYSVSGLTSGALAFVPGESSKTFEFSASRDNDGDDETVDLGFGSPLPTKVTEGTSATSHATSQVTIDDNYRRNSGGGGGGGNPPVKNPPVNNPPVNNPPVFNTGTVDTVSVAENIVAGTDIGDPITAADDDANDTLTYSLDAASAKVFTIVAETGQLQTKGALNYEVKNSYTVTVTATDSSGATATTDVTITITDEEEPPGKPDAPTVGPASTDGHNTLTVSWSAPYNTGPAITSYTVEYRRNDSTEWTATSPLPAPPQPSPACFPIRGMRRHYGLPTTKAPASGRTRGTGALRLLPHPNKST